MSTFGISLPDLEAFTATKSRKLSFPPDLEAAFQAQTQNYRKSVMRHIALPTALVYNAFLVADYVLVPDTFLLAAILHLAVVTPFVFLASFLYQRDLTIGVRELLAATVPALIVGQIMLIYALNHTPAAQHYQYLAILIVVFMNVNQRLGHRFAVMSTLALAVLYLAVLLPGQASFAAKLIGASSMAAVCHLTLLGNLRMERELRHSFLMRLRDRLRREGAEDAANRDPLTGISNRRYLDDTAARIWQQPDSDVSPIAVIMADIDHFKAYNDRYGHPAGDTCLKRVAGVISAELRDDDDLAVRLGGEEFLVVLPRTGRGHGDPDRRARPAQHRGPGNSPPRRRRRHRDGELRRRGRTGVGAVDRCADRRGGQRALRSQAPRAQPGLAAADRRRRGKHEWTAPRQSRQESRLTRHRTPIRPPPPARSRDEAGAVHVYPPDTDTKPPGSPTSPMTLDQTIRKRSVTIAGHRTSISLETAFWDGLRQAAARRGISVNALITEVDEANPANLSSALRVFVLGLYQRGELS